MRAVVAVIGPSVAVLVVQGGWHAGLALAFTLAFAFALSFSFALALSFALAFPFSFTLTFFTFAFTLFIRFLPAIAMFEMRGLVPRGPARPGKGAHWRP